MTIARLCRAVCRVLGRVIEWVVHSGEVGAEGEVPDLVAHLVRLRARVRVRARARARVIGLGLGFGFGLDFGLD